MNILDGIAERVWKLLEGVSNGPLVQLFLQNIAAPNELGKML